MDEIEMLLNPHESRENPTSSQVESKLRSDEKLGEEYGLSHAKVARYIRLAGLNTKLLEKVDIGEIPFLAAYDLSFIPASNEPSGRACTASWRMPRGSNTPLLAAGYLIEDGDRQCQIAELMESDNYKVDMKKAFVAEDSQGAFYNPLFIISQ